MRAPFIIPVPRVARTTAKRKPPARKFTPVRLVQGSACTTHCAFPDGPTLAVADAHVVVPVRTISETNAHEHHRYRVKRAAEQRFTTSVWLGQLGRADWRSSIVRVKFTRLAPPTSKLDQGDNLCSSSKFIRDQVAAWIGGNNAPDARGDDGPNCGVHWDQDHQEAHPAYGVRVEFYLSSAAGGGTT
jgi:hypothetical protein